MDVVVITGTGGVGASVARRIGAGSVVVLADVDPLALETATDGLRRTGLTVEPVHTDVSDLGSVAALAEQATGFGTISRVIHTAGVSPVQASADVIVRVDLLGTAHILDAFGAVIGHGGSGVCVASMAGSMTSLGGEFERRLTLTPTTQLADLPELAPATLTDPATAYTIAKRANQLRVRAAAGAWGLRGARINSVSPGVIATPMGEAELAGPTGSIMRELVGASAVGRVGTADEIAAAIGFLASPEASFVTGTDLLVDGGVIASLVT